MLSQTLRRLHASTGVTFHLWRISSLLVLLWAIVLIWGERVVFDRSVTACQWQRWEKWVCGNKMQCRLPPTETV